MVIVLSDSEVTAQLLSRGLEDDDVVNNILDRLAIGKEGQSISFVLLKSPVAMERSTTRSLVSLVDYSSSIIL